MMCELTTSRPSFEVRFGTRLREKATSILKHFRCVLLSLLLAATNLGVRAGTLDERIFAGKAAGERASVLVVLREQADLSEAASIEDPAERRRFVFEALRAAAGISQRGLAARLDESGARYRPHWLVNMVEVEADRPLAEELASRPDVSSLMANPAVALDPPPVVRLEDGRLAPPSAATVEPNLEKIRAPDVWGRGFTGQGIVVGVSDTGVTWDHPALKARYRGWNGAVASHDYNWHDTVHSDLTGNPCGAEAPAPCDDDTHAGGHGTAVAGLIVGDDGAGNRVGVAPGATWIGCRTMNGGQGHSADFVECLEFFLAPTDRRGSNPRPDLGADVINNSWGCGLVACPPPDIIRPAVENAATAGIFVVASAGNSGSQCFTVLSAPAGYASSFAVGSTTLADGIADFSSRGPYPVDGSNRLKPDLCAPGVNLRTALKPTGYRADFSGTSGSAPQVAGAVALLWSAAPSLKGHPERTADLLRASATKLLSAQDCGDFPGSVFPNAVFGWGRLDVAAALALTESSSRAAPGPASGRRGRVRTVPPRS